jgi:ferrous iron transport protein A
MQPLTELIPGGKAVIRRLDVPIAHRARLLEMGVLVGTQIELVRFAPLGDPVEIKVRGYHLTLRKQEAEQILVSPQPPRSEDTLLSRGIDPGN